jgi:hypothetical protein
MLGQRTQKDVPPLVPGRIRLVGDKSQSFLPLLPAVLLQKLGNQQRTLSLSASRRCRAKSPSVIARYGSG